MKDKTMQWTNPEITDGQRQKVVETLLIETKLRRAKCKRLYTWIYTKSHKIKKQIYKTIKMSPNELNNYEGDYNLQSQFWAGIEWEDLGSLKQK